EPRLDPAARAAPRGVAHGDDELDNPLEAHQGDQDRERDQALHVRPPSRCPLATAPARSRSPGPSRAARRTTPAPAAGRAGCPRARAAPTPTTGCRRAPATPTSAGPPHAGAPTSTRGPRSPWARRGGRPRSRC